MPAEIGLRQPLAIYKLLCQKLVASERRDKDLRRRRSAS